MKYIITDGINAYFSPLEFNAAQFQRWLYSLGVTVTLSSPDFDSGQYKIVPYIDNTPAYDSRFQVLGDAVVSVAGDSVTAIRPVSHVPVAQYVQQRVDEVVNRAIALLNDQAAGYSQIQIAAWPQIQADVIAYNADNANIGPAMQNAMIESSLDAAALAGLITPKINFKNAVFTNRNAHIAAIKAFDTTNESSSQAEIHAVLLSIADYDIGTGWPAL